MVPSGSKEPVAVKTWVVPSTGVTVNAALGGKF
jgi:hypothetical protein